MNFIVIDDWLHRDENYGHTSREGKGRGCMKPFTSGWDGRAQLFFPQLLNSCNEMWLLFHASHQSRHVFWGSASCHIEGTWAFALNVQEFPYVLPDSVSVKIHAGKDCFSVLLPPLHEFTLCIWRVPIIISSQKQPKWKDGRLNI